MLDSVQFSYYRALRDARLALTPFTLIVGPNGSGKSTALNALCAFSRAISGFEDVVTAGVVGDAGIPSLEFEWAGSRAGCRSRLHWQRNQAPTEQHFRGEQRLDPSASAALHETLARVRSYSLQPSNLAQTVPLAAGVRLGPRGEHFAAVLQTMRDDSIETFTAFNDEFRRWMPEFDEISLDPPGGPQKTIVLRTRNGRHRIPASQISDGTMLAIAMLTLAYLPSPPPLIGLEEPDHGLHPRLLQDVRDALYRLCYPAEHGESRPPVQVVATTHSPYFLDLFRDRPEQIVIANKVGHEATFTRLIDHPQMEEIIGDAPLGEVWFSGVLGGVPTVP